MTTTLLASICGLLSDTISMPNTTQLQDPATWEGTGLSTRHRMLRAMSKGLQIFQKSAGHIQILEARRMTRSKFHTDDPQPKSDIRTPLFSGAFSLVHEPREGGGGSKNIRHHSTTFSCLGDQGPGISASLVRRILLCGSLKEILQQTLGSSLL